MSQQPNTQAPRTTGGVYSSSSPRTAHNSQVIHFDEDDDDEIQVVSARGPRFTGKTPTSASTSPAKPTQSVRPPAAVRGAGPSAPRASAPAQQQVRPLPLPPPPTQPRLSAPSTASSSRNDEAFHQLLGQMPPPSPAPSAAAPRVSSFTFLQQSDNAAVAAVQELVVADQAKARAEAAWVAKMNAAKAKVAATAKATQQAKAEADAKVKAVAAATAAAARAAQEVKAVKAADEAKGRATAAEAAKHKAAAAKATATQAAANKAQQQLLEKNPSQPSIPQATNKTNASAASSSSSSLLATTAAAAAPQASVGPSPSSNQTIAPAAPSRPLGALVAPRRQGFGQPVNDSDRVVPQRSAEVAPVSGGGPSTSANAAAAAAKLAETVDPSSLVTATQAVDLTRGGDSDTEMNDATTMDERRAGKARRMSSSSRSRSGSVVVEEEGLNGARSSVHLRGAAASPSFSAKYPLYAPSAASGGPYAERQPSSAPFSYAKYDPALNARPSDFSAGTVLAPDGMPCTPIEIAQVQQKLQRRPNIHQYANHQGQHVAGKHALLDEADQPTTGLCYSTAMMLHSFPDTAPLGEEEREEEHPEHPRRIEAIFTKLRQKGLVSRMRRIPLRDVLQREVELVHGEGMWEGVEATALFTNANLAEQTKRLTVTSSLYVNEHSARCARLSAGGVLEMCDAVAAGRIRNGFAIVRPPGHHAEPDRSMGFCFYNNVAIAARFLQEKYKEGPNRIGKVMILDWDVHHGNGTQEIFWNDPSVLYVSIHRHEDGDFFPGGPRGGHDYTGADEAAGTNVNIPWPCAGMDDADYLAAFQHVVMPVAYEFKPDIVLISAGFDAAKEDPLGGCEVTPEGYAQMTHMLSGLANGKVVAALEGGYDLGAIANSSLRVTETLLGDPAPPIGELTAKDTASYAIRQVKRAHAKFWKCLTYDPLDPARGDDVGLPRIPLSDILRDARVQHLGTKYAHALGPLVPFYDEQEDQEALQSGKPPVYRGLTLVNLDILDREPAYDTIVLFVHEMGNLRAERPGLEVYAHEEQAYIVDTSSAIIDWALKKKYGLMDVSLPTQQLDRPNLKTRVQPGGAAHKVKEDHKNAADELITFLWDNYLALLLDDQQEAPVHLVLIGHGAGCDAIMTLLSTQDLRDITNNVRAVVMVPSHNSIPITPKNRKELRDWYYDWSKVILPQDHSFFPTMDQQRLGRRIGKTERSKEARPIQVLKAATPDIIDFIEKKLAAKKGPVLEDNYRPFAADADMEEVYAYVLPTAGSAGASSAQAQQQQRQTGASGSGVASGSAPRPPVQTGAADATNLARPAPSTSATTGGATTSSVPRSNGVPLPPLPPLTNGAGPSGASRAGPSAGAGGQASGSAAASGSGSDSASRQDAQMIDNFYAR